MTINEEFKADETAELLIKELDSIEKEMQEKDSISNKEKIKKKIQKCVQWYRQYQRLYTENR